MKILGLAGLFLFVREFTKGGVSPITVVPPDSPTGLTPEQIKEQQERERQRRIADAKSVAEQKKKEYEEFRKEVLVDLKFQADQDVIRNNPQNYVDCKYGFRPKLMGSGKKTDPYFWVCEKVPEFGF